MTPLNPPLRIAVIGAGICGAACARELARFGFKITVLEKARGVGGRFSVRRLGEGPGLPLGTALLPAATPGMEEWKKQIEEWSEAGLLKASVPSDFPHPVPARGVNSLVKHLLSSGDAHVEFKTSVRISRLARANASVVLLAEGEQGSAAANSAGSFDAVVLTAPLPQAIELLDASGLKDAVPSELREVRYVRSVVSLHRFRPGVLTQAAAGRLRLPDGAMLEALEDSVSWKSGPDFAGTHWDDPDLEPVAHSRAIAEMQSRGWLAVPGGIEERSFHRWKFSRVENPVSVPFHQVGGPGAPLMLAGDAFGAGDAASAFFSGLSAARALAGNSAWR